MKIRLKEMIMAAAVLVLAGVFSKQGAGDSAKPFSLPNVFADAPHYSGCSGGGVGDCIDCDNCCEAGGGTGAGGTGAGGDPGCGP